MQAKELKEYISQERDRIEKVLEFYGFHSIWYSGVDLRCSTPDGDNKTAVSVKMSPELYASCFSDLIPYRGDLLGLIEHVSESKFKDIVMNIHNLLGLEMTRGKPKTKMDLLADIRKYKKRGAGVAKENKKFDKDKLSDFVMLPHASILQEHISSKVCKQFDVCYDPKKDRIVFPHYDWIDTDKIVGITGRTTLDSQIAKELQVPKYWNYIRGYYKTNNLFGFNNATPGIDKAKMVIIFEAEKSVLKQFTIEQGVGYAVSVGGHEISQEQVDFLIRNTSPDTEIVIAFDKDIMMMKEEDFDNAYDDDGRPIEAGEQYLIDTCKRFNKYRTTSYIYDQYNVLGEKDAPIDCGMKIWGILLKYRKRV